MKKVISILLVLIIFTSSLFTVSFASGGINIVINGIDKVFDVMPDIVDGRTMVPVRGIFEEFGAQIQWEESTRTVTAQINDKTIVLVVDHPVAKVNEENIQLDVAAQIINGRTMVPVRFVAESLGCKVDWNADTKTVIITGGDGGVRIGNMTESTYINDFAGIGFNLPEGWTFRTRNEINEIYGIVVDMMNTKNLMNLLEQSGSYLDMMATAPTGDNVQVSINTGFGISEQEYCQNIVSSLAQQVEVYGINVDNVVYVNKSITGAKLHGVQFESSYSGITVYQIVLVKNVGDYSVLYTASSTDAASVEDIIKGLFAV